MPGSTGGPIRWTSSLQCLAAHHVLALGEVAHDVEVLEAVELGEQLAAALGLVAGLFAGGGAERVEDEAAQVTVGLEVTQPLDELGLERLGGHDRLRAVPAAAACATAVAAVLGA